MDKAVTFFLLQNGIARIRSHTLAVRIRSWVVRFRCSPSLAFAYARLFRFITRVSQVVRIRSRVRFVFYNFRHIEFLPTQ